MLHELFFFGLLLIFFLSRHWRRWCFCGSFMFRSGMVHDGTSHLRSYFVVDRKWILVSFLQFFFPHQIRTKISHQRVRERNGEKQEGKSETTTIFFSWVVLLFFFLRRMARKKILFYDGLCVSGAKKKKNCCDQEVGLSLPQ